MPFALHIQEAQKQKQQNAQLKRANRKLVQDLAEKDKIVAALQGNIARLTADKKQLKDSLRKEQARVTTAMAALSGSKHKNDDEQLQLEAGRSSPKRKRLTGT